MNDSLDSLVTVALARGGEDSLISSMPVTGAETAAVAEDADFCELCVFFFLLKRDDVS